MENKDLYYNQPELWGKAAEQYQIQVLKDILSIIPRDVHSILDIGCGDGYITNSIPAEIEVLGLDISEEALKYVKRKKIVGDITNLPFEDNSFDLIMANDVIEHLDNENLQKAVGELKRVSSKYILITVPINEDIESKKTKCSDCGNLYHVNMHNSALNENFMVKLFSDDVWAINEARYSGGVTLPPWDPTIELKHNLGYFAPWEGCVCPNCGSTKQVPIDETDFKLRVINALRHNLWFSKDIGTSVNRSELIALYTKKDFERKIESNYANYVNSKKSLYEIDFTNKLQAITSEFIPGLSWARYRFSKNAAIDERGLSKTDKSKEYTEIQIKVPAVSEEGDFVEIELESELQPDDKVALYIIDGISGTAELFYEKSIEEKHLKLEIPIVYQWTPDKFGLAFTIYLYGNPIIKKFRYCKKSGSNNVVPFMQLQKGHNVVYACNRYIRSWGLFIEESGAWPFPEWLLNEAPQNKKTEEITNLEILDISKLSGDFLIRKHNRLNDLLNNIYTQKLHVIIYNRALSKLSKIYKKLKKHISKYRVSSGEIHAVNDISQSDEQQIASNEISHRNIMGIIETDESAEILDKENAKNADLLENHLTRKVQKVLVLSHMFPYKEEKINGSFVHEQVKALRDYEGIDARVISCRPFWLSGINVVRLLIKNMSYTEQLKNVEWTEYEGVPVLYPPYRVGIPFIPIHLRAWIYRNVVLGIIDKVWQEFKFDLVHSHTAYLDGTAGLAVANKYNVPFVITEHTGPFTTLTSRPIIRQLSLKAIKSANRTWCVSDSLAHEVKSYFDDESVTEKIKVCYNGVLTGQFHSNNKRCRNHINLFFVGYLVDVKNPLNLIKAFAKVREVVPNVKLNIVGDGVLKNEVNKLAKELKVDGACVFYGMKTREKVAEIIREECDILVLPSKAETFGVVVIEALACGKPVVATKCGGPESIITEDFLGKLCENYSVDDLANSIIEVIRNIDKYDPEMIREYVINKFDYKVIAKQVSEQYQSIERIR